MRKAADQHHRNSEGAKGCYVTGMAKVAPGDGYTQLLIQWGLRVWFAAGRAVFIGKNNA